MREEPNASVMRDVGCDREGTVLSTDDTERAGSVCGWGTRRISNMQQSDAFMVTVNDTFPKYTQLLDNNRLSRYGETQLIDKMDGL